jgi:hypothetical protein
MQIAVAPPGDMPVAIYLSGLVSARRQIHPSASGSRCPKVAGDQYEQAANLIPASGGNELPAQLGSAPAGLVPALQPRQDGISLTSKRN